MRAQADALQAKVDAAYQAAGRPLPDWWTVFRASVLSRTLASVNRVAGLGEWRWGVPEWNLPVDCEISLGAGVDAVSLAVTGRIDLLLTAHPISAGETPPAGDAWVLDFKTGSDKPLSLKLVEAGKGLQLALYALALEQLGFSGVSASVVKHDLPLEQQLDAQDAATAALVSERLPAIVRSSVLGDAGEIRSEFSFTGDFPLATLQVPPELLEARLACASGQTA